MLYLVWRTFLMPAVKTVAAAMTEVRELRQKSAVSRTLIQILRTRFLPRDGIPQALAEVSCEGAVIEEVIEELEDSIADLEKQARVILGETVA
jgi:hypothetical protein